MTINSSSDHNVVTGSTKYTYSACIGSRPRAAKMTPPTSTVSAIAMAGDAYVISTDCSLRRSRTSPDYS